MSCGEWDEAIARFVDGEVAAAGLTEHLECCGDCSKLLRDLRGDQAELRRAPEIDSAVCTALRIEVLQRVARRRIGWRWYVAAASFATVLLVAGMWLRPLSALRQPIVVRPQTPAPRQIEKPMIASGHPMRKRMPRARVAKSTGVVSDNADGEKLLAEWLPVQTRRAPRGSRSEVAMRIQTCDPDVVILWLKEERFQ